MRGCLTVLVTGIAFLAILAWFALPPLAGAVVTTGLVVSGLSGTGTTIEVTASPPYELLTLHADAVTVHSTEVSWRGMRAATLDVRLTGVDLGARTAAAISGRLDGVTIPTASGSASVQRLDLAGPSSAARVTLTIDPATATSLAAQAVEAVVGQPPSSIRLVAPDQVIVTVAGRQVVGTLSVDASGALIVTVPPFGHTAVADPSTEVPIVLETVAVTATGDVVLGGTLDPRALGLSR